MQYINIFIMNKIFQFWHLLQSPSAGKLALPLCLGLVIGTFAPEALAQAMPWEGPICKVAQSLAGPTAKAVAVIAVVISGLMLAFGELGGLFKTLMGLLMGISMALMAAQWGGFVTGTGAIGLCS